MPEESARGETARSAMRRPVDSTGALDRAMAVVLGEELPVVVDWMGFLAIGAVVETSEAPRISGSWTSAQEKAIVESMSVNAERVRRVLAESRKDREAGRQLKGRVPR